MNLARNLVSFAEKTRNLKDRGLTEGASTRLLIHAATLVTGGVDIHRAMEAAVAAPLTDEDEMLESLCDILRSIL